MGRINCPHVWAILPATDGHDQYCTLCDAVRKTPKDLNQLEMFPSTEAAEKELSRRLGFPPAPTDLWDVEKMVKTYRDNVTDAALKAGVEVHGDYNKPGQGVKKDQGKDQFHYIPFDLMGGENRVWVKGAEKYSPNNWRNGMPVTQPLNAALRHIHSFAQGEDLDPETAESHIDHAICCLRMIQNTMKYYPHLDDRVKWAVKSDTPTK